MKNSLASQRQAWLLALLASLFLLAPLAFAQEGTGTITVDVTDAQRAPLPGVKLTILVDEKPRTQVSDTEGKALFDSLAPGTYTVTAEIEGFTAEASAEVKRGKATPVSLVLRSVSDGKP